MGETSFRAVSHALRLHAGEDALERLEAEAERVGARRAFVLCGRTVSTHPAVVPRIERALGARLAGVYPGMDKDSTWPAVRRGVELAREAGADLLIAVGGGSVIAGARVVAILLAETGDPLELMTQYPEGKPAYSPRLEAPKPPVFNVVTTPTTAMNRAGSGLRNDDLDHRMEYYDPKTRPAAIFWDSAALLSAPADLVRSTAITTYSGVLRMLGGAEGNPLVAGDREQAFRLLAAGLPRVMTDVDDAALRIDLCAAAFLENRAADDDVGRRRERDPVSAGSYALATALHILYEQVRQGEATSAVMPGVTRALPPEDPAVAERIAGYLGAWREGMSAAEAAHASGDALEAFYRSTGMPARLGEIGVPRADFPAIVRATSKNFNANPGARGSDADARMLSLLEACW